MANNKKSATVQERSLRTREVIEKAALKAFAELGYEGASTRQIADLAGVKQQLITYHFGSKLKLWKVVADKLFTDYRAHMEERQKGLDGVDALTTAQILIRDFLEYCAGQPQLARFMMHEGGVLTPRLSWLVETHTGGLIRSLQAQVDEARRLAGAPEVDVVQLSYILIGASAMFSQEAEYKLLTGEPVNSARTIESYSALVSSLILG